jgi:hypothetical protein
MILNQAFPLYSVKTKMTNQFIMMREYCKLYDEQTLGFRWIFSVVKTTNQSKFSFYSQSTIDQSEKRLLTKKSQGTSAK